jgi:integrase
VRGANAPPRLQGPTFSEIAKRWTSSELAQEWPDHVKTKDLTEDERKIKFLNELDVGGMKFGDLPLSRFKLDHAEAAMRQLPKSAKRPATRRHYAQCIARVLALAVYPLRLIPRNPLPKGFMPKAGKPPGFSYLYPAEDAALMACKTVPLAERLLFGFLAREGMRAGAALRLAWNDLDLDRGVITLDRNKTDEARAWALDAGVVAALSALRKEREPAGETAVFLDAEGNPFEIHELARRLRQQLWEAKVRRSELHTKGENRGRLRVHDLFSRHSRAPSPSCQAS